MAKFILTDEEKQAKSLLDWSDNALGKAVRFCITTLMRDADENKSVFAIACGQVLCALASEANATELNLKLEGVSNDGKQLGDWEIFVAKKVAN